MAYALTAKREARASGAMALHSLEIMEGLLISASESRFCEFESHCERANAAAKKFPGR
jgi:hypothetical protein